ncbi:glycosyltransferase [Saccharophagus sp. K07]|uniref:glycosyltransferase n=1 Tax=Saccharophagus sp. K07 TaxID=2283636 RepID=UPI0016525D28|nr:glycosyltransferase [Saccharophagus sp. K07]MBC6907474.1 glycosyltransferase [Saccharophagus sp. K07]
MILAIGPLPPPVTGQAKAFEAYVLGTQKKCHVIDINYEGFGHYKKIFKATKYLVRLLLLVFGKEFSVLYITNSRTVSGSLRDIAAILLFKLGARKRSVVVHLHGSDFSDFYSSQKGFFRFLLRCAYDKVDFGIVLTKGMVEQFEHFPKIKVFVVSNYCEDFLPIGFSIDEKISNIEAAQEINVLYMSNCIKSKGLCELVEAVVAFNEVALNDGFRPIVLNIAGLPMADEYATEEEMRSFLSLFNSEYIRYHGFVEGRAKAELYMDAHVVALPTYYKSEAQPLCLIEGAYAGNALLVSRHNYNEEMLKVLDGVLIDKRSVSSIVEAFQELQDVGRLSSICRVNYHRARANFSKIKYIESIDDVVGIGI